MGKKKAEEAAKPELIEYGPGYDSKMDVHYDKKYVIGGTTCYMIAPKITREESDRRWQQVCEVASRIVLDMLERGIILDFTPDGQEKKDGMGNVV